MGRRRKGGDVGRVGWWWTRPAAWTSTAVVNKVRWALDARQGRPMRARLIRPATGGSGGGAGEAHEKPCPTDHRCAKCYRFTVRLGRTNTD